MYTPLFSLPKEACTHRCAHLESVPTFTLTDPIQLDGGTMVAGSQSGPYAALNITEAGKDGQHWAPWRGLGHHCQLC